MDFLYKHRVKATVNAMAPLIVPESIEVQASIFSQKNHGHRFLGDRKGILLIDFLECGLTINADAYCETVRKLRRAIQKKDVECCPVGLCFCMTMRDLLPQLELLNCCNNFAGKFLTTRPTAPISRQATTTYSCI